MRRLLIAGLTAGLAWAVPTQAQDGWGWSTIIPSVTGTDVLGTHLRQIERERRAPPARSTAGQPAPAHPNASGAATSAATFRYAPSRTRRTANLAAFIERGRKTDPVNAAALEKQFAQGDIIDKLGAALAPTGLHTDNLADAYALWWIVMWNGSRGVSAEPNRTRSIAVRDQVAQLLGPVPGIAGASDARKQEMAEGMLLQAMLIDAAVEQAAKDPAMLRQIKARIVQNARGMGLDLPTMTLTDKGFVPA